MILRRAVVVAAVAASLVLVAGCTSQPPVVHGSSGVTVTPTPDAVPAPTCETLIRSDLVESLTSHNWTAETDTFRIGNIEVPGGLWCQWGDYSVASDHVQIYGWARIDAADADAARAQLLKDGWHELDGGYVTQDSATTFNTDADGYGMTYQFGDGWVTVSDTKQGLLVIQRPAS
ncbi:hypothetical protein [Microbacterium sp. SORGH_AS_0888]|uniref:hypothetical protein n=1 Tax=Microbacterium sp. SORGH_AS_0888 TaxID=3041791 RepID=UPI002783C4DA|nr:hypothetical protein [Microbacterium sp. SORGH_AS_0888]MDQ1128274.1 outer membrane murein-binding lipoprotein Lpp [Microbacterium sp. SORGH_AS_0888]